MKINQFNIDLLRETEEQLYKLRNEFSDKNEAESPLNDLIDWIQDEQTILKNRLEPIKMNIEQCKQAIHNCEDQMEKIRKTIMELRKEYRELDMKEKCGCGDCKND